MLKPTLDVEVADPEILRPATVVVPNPVPETESLVEEAELTTSNIVSAVEEAHTVSLA
jgi:hypothetical protein